MQRLKLLMEKKFVETKFNFAKFKNIIQSESKNLIVRCFVDYFEIKAMD